MLLLIASVTLAQNHKEFTLHSPDGKIVVTIEAGAKMNWSVKHGADVIIAPSPVSLTLGCYA